MKNLTKEEKIFFERILKSCKIEKHGYINFTFRKKHYKRSRIFMQLYLNKKLELWEIVHHKDGNKQNDHIKNLEVMDLSVHTSMHHAGSKHGK